MPDWIITPASNAMDKIVSYRTVLQAMRQFVRQNAVVSDTVNIYHDAARTQRTSLRYSNNNYQVDQINGQNILYNYPDPLPDFNMTVSRTKCNTLLRCRHGLTLPPTLRRRTRLHHADDPPGA